MIMAMCYRHHMIMIWSYDDHVVIPDICPFLYTDTFCGLKIIHQKVHKFATKIASSQNSINLRHKLPHGKIL